VKQVLLAAATSSEAVEAPLPQGPCIVEKA